MSNRNPTRRYRRRTIRIVVEYLCDAGTRSETATTLGAGGLFIESDTPPSEGTILKLRFRVSPEGVQHELEGRVVWSRGIAAGHVGTPGMGIEFTDRRAVKELAEDLEAID
jgi:Tfp pilus assembly protein PilZ